MAKPVGLAKAALEDKVALADKAVNKVRLADIVAAIESEQVLINKSKLSVYDDKIINSIASLHKADRHSLAFLAKALHKKTLGSTQAAAVIVSPADQADVPKDTLAIVVADPYLAYACVSGLFDNKSSTTASIHASAVIADSANIGQNVCIGAFCVIGENARIADGCVLGTNVVIGNGVTLGQNVVIDSHVVIYHDCTLGDECRVHAHATIGADGFGFAPKKQGWQRIAQLGRVVIGKRVRIGANTCIDRGAIDDTVIGDDVIIDNLVQIAHNVKIGQGSAIAAKTGIAGSTTIGKGCIIGGAVGIAGHLTIADGVVLTGRTFVTKSISQAGSYSSGTTAMPTADWRRAAVKFRQMGNTSPQQASKPKPTLTDQRRQDDE